MDQQCCTKNDIFASYPTKENRFTRHDLIAAFLVTYRYEPTVSPYAKQNWAARFKLLRKLVTPSSNDFSENSCEYFSEHVLTPPFFS